MTRSRSSASKRKKDGTVGVGVIGYGYWGPNLVRNFADVPGASLVAVCDRDAGRLAKARAAYPGILATRDASELIRDRRVDAVVVATPIASHFELATQALKAGKHVLVEKPLTGTVEQALRLIEQAQARRRVLMVDHTFVYTGAIRKIREIMDSGQLGKLYYYDSVRVNLGLFLHDKNVLWDLAVHDLAILDYLLGEAPTAVSAVGKAHLPHRPADMAYLACFFDNGVMAHSHVNWLSPVKVRQTLIGGDRRMVVYNDLEADEKIRVYDKGVSVVDGREPLYEALVSYRTGDMFAPRLERAEALGVEARHFLDCINDGRRPTTDGAAGLRVVRILAAADQSMARRGAPVELDAASV